MINNNDIDKLFQQSLEDFSDTPSDMIWAGLENQLVEKNKHIHSNRRYKILFFTTLTLLVIISSLLLGFFITNKDNLKSNNNIVSNNLNQNNSLNNEQSTNHSQSQNSNYSKTQTSKPNSQKPITNNILPPKNTNYINQYSKNKRPPNDLLDLTSKNLHSQNKLNSKNKHLVEKEQIKFNLNIEKKDYISNNEDKRNFVIPCIASLNIMAKNSKDVFFKMPLSTPHIQNILIPKRTFISRISISPYISYDLSYRKLKGEADQINFFNSHEKYSYSLSYGAKIGIDINNKWSIGTGVIIQYYTLLSNSDIATKYLGEGKSNAMIFTSFNTNDVQFSLNKTDKLNIGDIKYISSTLKQKTKWLNIPFMIDYNVHLGKFGVNIASGFSASIFLNDKLIFNDNKKVFSEYKQTFSETSSQTFYSYTGELNFHYYPISKIDIFAGIHYQNALTSANKSKAIGFYPYLYGLQLGLKGYL